MLFAASWLVVGLLHSPQYPSLQPAQQASARVVAQRPVMCASAVVEAAALKPPRTREDMIQQAAAAVERASSDDLRRFVLRLFLPRGEGLSPPDESWQGGMCAMRPSNASSRTRTAAARRARARGSEEPTAAFESLRCQHAAVRSVHSARAGSAPPALHRDRRRSTCAHRAASRPLGRRRRGRVVCPVIAPGERYTYA